jgi:hypothetical protein
VAINMELAKATLEYIEAHPEEHKQEHWCEVLDCGTAGCFAYHVCRIAGFKVDMDTAWRGLNGTIIVDRLTTGVSIDEKAAELLNLNPWQAGDLFSTNNTVDTIKQLINDPEFANSSDGYDDDDDYWPEDDEYIDD